MAHIAVHEALWRVALGEPGPSDSFSCPSPNGVIVKAACGKSAQAVWAAGGGQREGSTERASPDPTARVLAKGQTRRKAGRYGTWTSKASEARTTWESWMRLG